MNGPTPVDLVISFVPITGVIVFCVWIVLAMNRQTKLLERIAAALDKRG